MGVSTIGIK